jgi:CheY-like chemotaxis protein
VFKRLKEATIMKTPEKTTESLNAASRNQLDGPWVPNVVVVDPRFDAYKSLAASARLGKLNLHFRSSGADAIKLSRKQPVDAWLIATDLDDMSGHDLVELLRSFNRSFNAGQEVGQADEAQAQDSQPVSQPACKIAVVQPATTPSNGVLELGAELSVLTPPITFQDLETLLGMKAGKQQSLLVAPRTDGKKTRSFFEVPVAVGAAIISVVVMIVS